MKRLELEIVKKVVDEGSEWYEVRIKNQTHRSGDFSYDGRFEFVAKNKMKIRSVGCPQWKPFENILFVRGYDKSKDNNILSMSVDDYKKVMEAVKEYNETFGPIMSDMIDDNLFEVQ